MGILQRSADKYQARLFSQSRVGRALDCEVLVEQAQASSVHASIEWRSPGQWEIRDLSSRNGTFIDGARLATGQWYPLALGQRLGFGDLEHDWSVIDLERPPAEARCLVTLERRVADGQVLALSHDPLDWLDVVEDHPSSWVVERNGDCEAARDGQELLVGEHRWRLVLPTGLPPTEVLDADPVAVEAPRMVFRVSADLEYVELVVEWSGQTETTARAYTRGLLELARARLADQERSSAHTDEHGWIYADDLCTLAGYESESRLNVEVHRARRDLARLAIPDAASLIQRRRGTRQLRIGTPALEIVELSK